MTLEIEAQISRLQGVFHQLKSKLDFEIEVNKGLRDEIKNLNVNLENINSQNREMQRLTSELKGQLEQKNTQESIPTENTGIFRNSDEIDALVKEIEYCISQLKNK